jgi:hypothetical protein
MPRTLSDVIEGHVSTVFMNAEHFAVAITYTRGATSVSLTAIVEPNQFDQLTELGATKTERRGFLIETSTLDLGSGVTQPQIGDLITDAGRTYIVPKQSELPRWEYADEDRLMIRVNTTLKSAN